MKALCWYGKKDIRYDTVPDPMIEEPRDAIIKVTSCAICGSDLHLAATPIGALDLACARAADERAQGRAGARFDYSDRVGMAGPAESMRGAARDFEPPRDMRQPEALRSHAREPG